MEQASIVRSRPMGTHLAYGGVPQTGIVSTSNELPVTCYAKSS